MARRFTRSQAPSRCTRFRIGRVSVYFHHGGWWLYYRQQDRPVRRRVAETREAAERIAAELNVQLTVAAPSMFDFRPIGAAELRAEFLDFHEHVQRSSIGTIERYGTATQHLIEYVATLPRPAMAHEISATGFATYLRSSRVSPNGHRNTVVRPLRDKGVQFIMETCRSMFAFAQRQRHLPPYATNPFADLRLDRMKIEDAKPIFVFDAATERRFFAAAHHWEFPIHFTLAKTGLRPGELCHLLIEEVDLAAGWLHVRNKPELGWSVKTRNERSVPMHPVVQAVLQRVIGVRTTGVVFRRPKYSKHGPPANLSRLELGEFFSQRLAEAGSALGAVLSRETRHRLAAAVWQEAGALDPDHIRRSFIRVAQRCGLSQATCPKSWRHSFATLLQDANIDPLLRQITLGHKPSGAGSVLGMTSAYTHSRPETHSREIIRSIALQPQSLELGQQWVIKSDTLNFQRMEESETDFKAFPSPDRKRT